MTQENKGVLTALLGAFTFSMGAPLVIAGSKYFSPEILTFCRMLLASILLLLVAIYNKHSLHVETKQRKTLIFVGLITFIHFYSFIYSLYDTSVIRALCLTYLAPCWTFLYQSLRGFENNKTSQKWLMLGVTFLGLLLLLEVFKKPDILQNPFNFGDAMALLSGIALSIYHISGTNIQRKVHTLTYVFWVYLISALPFLLLIPFNPKMQQCDFNLASITIIFLVAFIPTFGGHTLINMSLRRIPPPLVSLISTLEVPGGTITTAFLLMKLPTNIEIFGSLVMMTGIAGFYLVEGIANRSIQPKKEHPMRECS